MLEYIQTYFPLWTDYLDGNATTLQGIIDQSIIDLSDYIEIDTDNITDIQKRYIFHLVRKMCFDTKHGDTEFESPPQIVKDYYSLIKKLEDIRKGKRNQYVETSDDEPTSIKITAKPRKFDSWFT